MYLLFSLTHYSDFHQVLAALTTSTFYNRYVFPPVDETPPEIKNDPKFSPYFKNARAATDGTHYAATVPAEETAAHRNRKGYTSQNVLACCTFDMRFTYVMAGWEGSVADGKLWEIARDRDLAILPERYYLGDAGFPSCDALLVPYRGVRYHLREFQHTHLA